MGRLLPASDEKGLTLVLTLLFLLILSALSLTAMMSTGTELRIAANDRSAKEAFYVAEAGLEDARSRLQDGSTAPIVDGQPASIAWTAFIGTQVKCQGKGYQSGNGSHSRYDRLTSLDYVTTITHKLNAGNQILKWGDVNGDGKPEENTGTGEIIYAVRSEGSSNSGGIKRLSSECVKVPPLAVPAALYTKADTTIQGSSTTVTGMDGCGGASLPGIVTRGAVAINGGPAITGSPVSITEYSTMNLDLDYLIEQLKGRASSIYNVNSATLTGMNWGSPVPGATPQDPSSCGTRNIVHIQTSSTYVQLSGGTSGCGLLLVEGDLSVHGGFQWYGAVLVTGSITFSGGGGKNVTGAVLAGGMVSADLLSGDASLIYCSTAVRSQTDSLPLTTLRWSEVFD